ncbi:hypothetical protein RND81_04G239700 [Saponaria officinalis]|uniref:Glycosyltransferase n=1 Tax=Saponaria officinalis TaxID=3572 RepID=A0AAW1LP18_SAPOF
MANENNTIQVIMLPYHGQGHMNTMVQFAKRLAWKGVNVTIATTINTTQQMLSNISSSYKSITFEPIYDDTDDSQLHIKDRMARFEAEAASNLTKVLAAKKQQALNKKCLLVYHGSLNWALVVAHQQNVAGAAFFTAATASFACYYYLNIESQGKGIGLELPLVLPNPKLIVQKLPKSFLAYGDNNSNTTNMGLHPLVLWLLKDYGNSVNADFVLLNSFDKLEEEAVKWISNICNVKTIGPTIPSIYLDKQIENDVDYGFNQYKPTNEDCIKWLNTKEANCVVYIAFGSVARLSVEQMVEIAKALDHSPKSFLWVVRETEREKLPANLIEKMSGKGLVVPWAPQLEVLAHDAVGCFMSHCGWNSTIEALSFGVPILAMPQFLDQLVDAHFVDRVWGVGITPTADENDLVTREEINRCLDELMGGPKGEKIKENAAMWKESAKAALEKGGSSDKHIDEIIEWLSSS